MHQRTNFTIFKLKTKRKKKEKEEKKTQIPATAGGHGCVAKREAVITADV